MRVIIWAKRVLIEKRISSSGVTEKNACRSSWGRAQISKKKGKRARGGELRNSSIKKRPEKKNRLSTQVQESFESDGVDGVGGFGPSMPG